MASKNIGIREDVYERLKAHKRGDESFSEAIDRILGELDSDWRTNAGFLSDAEADELDRAVADGLAAFDDATENLGEEIDEQLTGESP